MCPPASPFVTSPPRGSSHPVIVTGASRPPTALGASPRRRQSNDERSRAGRRGVPAQPSPPPAHPPSARASRHTRQQSEPRQEPISADPVNRALFGTCVVPLRFGEQLPDLVDQGRVHGFSRRQRAAVNGGLHLERSVDLDRVRCDVTPVEVARVQRGRRTLRRHRQPASLDPPDPPHRHAHPQPRTCRCWIRLVSHWAITPAATAGASDRGRTMTAGTNPPPSPGPYVQDCQKAPSALLSSNHTYWSRSTQSRWGVILLTMTVTQPRGHPPPGGRAERGLPAHRLTAGGDNADGLCGPVISRRSLRSCCMARQQGGGRRCAQRLFR